MPSDAQLHAAVDAIYRSAGQPDTWPGTLTMLADLFGSTTAGFAYGRRGGGGGISLFVRSDSAWERQYAEYYSFRNPYIRNEHRIRQGLVAAGQSFIRDADLLKTEFYSDFLAKQDLLHSLAAFPLVRDDTASTVVFYRPQRHPQFGKQAVHLLRLLSPHLALAMQIHERFACNAQPTAAAAALSAEMPFGVMVLDATGKVRLLNAAAERIIAMNDGIGLMRGELVLGTADETQRLRGCVRSASTVPSAPLAQRGGTVVVRRRSMPSGAHSFRVVTSPLDTGDRRAFPGALVFVSEPDKPVALSPEHVSLVLDVTLREAALVAGLAAGHDLRTYAHHADISVDTARTHLKNIFRKTQVRSQAELIALVLRMPGLDRPGVPETGR
jgi:DNA-binding CsgD family transcriptional regulator